MNLHKPTTQLQQWSMFCQPWLINTHVYILTHCHTLEQISEITHKYLNMYLLTGAYYFSNKLYFMVILYGNSESVPLLNDRFPAAEET